jgi:hypothetical protein
MLMRDAPFTTASACLGGWVQMEDEMTTAKRIWIEMDKHRRDEQGQ